ncbi:hypothetical protein ACE1SV_65390 [Streptomyces sennicomposti]
MCRGIAEQGQGQVVFHQGFVQVGDDARGGVGQPVQESEERGLHVCRGSVDRRGDRPFGQVEQVVALVAVQAQGSGEGGEGLGRGLHAVLRAAAFQLGVVVG